MLGSFDSVNPLIVKGVAARGVREHTLESLMGRSLDEPFSLYGLLAETIETDEERTYVEFTLDPRAKFSDGEPVTDQPVHLLGVRGVHVEDRSTDAQGSVRFEKVAPGSRYTLHVKGTGFAEVLLRNIEVLPGRVTELADLNLGDKA